MFDNISKEKLRNIILFKYCFQLIIFPIIFGLIAMLVAFFTMLIVFDLKYSVNMLFGKSVLFGIEFDSWWYCFALSGFINLSNILSVVPFFKLIADSLSKDNVQTSEIEFTKIMPMYELQCIRQSKRFMCDTFSRKKNEEAFIYDQNNKKYRFFWNEKYGSIEELKKLASAKTLKISYFKHSRIIFDCQIISEAEPFGDMSHKE